ncbi:DNA-directed RNA polymerase I subunit RPA12-like [Cucumis melo var. makuwa]|uniref:DNA-directed RNA polymerase I subunit RPA12 n=1 Tax=Cucumis melo var. makuwa TaxID=1194695 RepID=A0A5A7VET3_CUCMM|nr:DNA-directed RNA polymerase I subunit RPA12-like [Cucumis melo var. makuwa]
MSSSQLSPVDCWGFDYWNLYFRWQLTDVEINGREISYTVTAEEIRKQLGISLIGEEKMQLAKERRRCEKCGNDEAWFESRQMRSADEGQTTFYTCTKCHHQTREN